MYTNSELPPCSDYLSDSTDLVFTSTCSNANLLIYLRDLEFQKLSLLHKRVQDDVLAPKLNFDDDFNRCDRRDTYRGQVVEYFFKKVGWLRYFSRRRDTLETWEASPNSYLKKDDCPRYIKPQLTSSQCLREQPPQTQSKGWLDSLVEESATGTKRHNSDGAESNRNGEDGS